MELVGEDWLSQNLGSMLLAVAAIMAASLAAYVATRNHRQQLEHDRQVRRDEHIRDVVDAAITSVSKAVRAATLLSATMQALEIWRDSYGEPSATKPGSDEAADEEELKVKLEPARGDAYNSLVELLQMGARLEMRLGPSHPISTSHAAVLKAMEELHFGASPAGVMEANREPDEVEAEKTRSAALTSAFAEFRRACHSWFTGSELQPIRRVT
jgi:hypothetical protein